MIRKIKYFFQRRIRGWSDDETWDLSISFMKWINSRFIAYKEHASKKVDLEFHKIKYELKEYTLLELINKIIDLTDRYIVLTNNFFDNEEELEKIKNQVLNIFKEMYWYMWW